MRDILLLSPAFCGGRRARTLIEPKSDFALARQLAEGRLTIGDAFAFMSGLYFRGKLAYARCFGRPTGAEPRSFVITPTRGLQRLDWIVTTDILREFATVDVDAANPVYRAPLERDIAALAVTLEADARVILLGSIATGKYVDVLTHSLGARLHYPPSFIGRGDMSRGGLLLRHAAATVALEYAPVDPAAKRRGARPPKLPPLRTADGVVKIWTKRKRRRSRPPGARVA